MWQIYMVSDKKISHAGQDPKLSLAYLADRYHKPCTSQVGEFKVVLPFPSGTGFT